MRRFTIIPEDNLVIVDGDARKVDCSSVSPTIHAVQWDNDRKKGWIEFRIDHVDEALTPPNEGKPANKIIESFEEFHPVLDLWGKEMRREDADCIAKIDMQLVGMIEELERRREEGLPVDQAELEVRLLKEERDARVKRNAKAESPR